MKAVFKSVASLGFAIAAASALPACGDNNNTGGDDLPDAAPGSLVHASDVPVDGLSPDDVAKFNDGDALFDLPFRPADGLGPLYVRTACGSCHEEGSRGPGLVQKMSVVEADGITASPDQSELPFGHSVREGLTSGAVTPIVPPDDPDVKVSIRLGPPTLGRGYMEAISDDAIEAQETAEAARTDAIHGRINRVTFTSVPNPDTTFGTYTTGETNLIGRFGVKAREVSLDDFAADAFQGDMGLTTPMRPTELPNPDGLTDDERPGVDLPQNHVDRIAFYLRRIAIPLRVGLTDEGAALFAQAQCSGCHAPTMHTRADYPIPQLADVDVPVFTDMLLHDLGPDLADGMTDGSASSTLWRTAPLIGLRFSHTYLHDGRAGTVEEAILAHEGEAQASADAFRALSDADRQTLLAYVEAL